MKVIKIGHRIITHVSFGELKSHIIEGAALSKVTFVFSSFDMNIDEVEGKVYKVELGSKQNLNYSKNVCTLQISSIEEL